MSNSDPYKIAYERERLARKKAESLLDEKTRSLYDNVIQLQTTVDALEEAHEQLVQSEKMASIGQLAAGVAHEINNPISFSLSNLTMLSEYIDSFIKLDAFFMDKALTPENNNLLAEYKAIRKKEDIEFIVEDVTGLLRDSITGLNRVSQIVANLKKVTHTAELIMAPCDINNVIEESIKVVWNELKYHMQIEKNFSKIPQLACHSCELHQVLMNLFLNASHACKDKGILTVKTFTKIIKEKEWAVIEITDNGTGMPKEILKKIFDPFFTTKPVGVGTGLGLSISFGIIEKHKGKIQVASEENKGTTFTITLPIEQ